MKSFVLIVKPDGTEERIERETQPELHEVQAWVGGYVQELPHQHQYAGQPAQFYVNEDGKMEGLPPNSLADRILNMARTGLPGDYIAGNLVILCGRGVMWT